MPVLLGVSAFAFDIGGMILAAQRVQDVSDAAALAGAANAAEPGVRDNSLNGTMAANNASSPWQVTTSRARFFVPGEEIAGYGTLGHRDYAAEVIGETGYDFTFARIFGLDQTDIRRRAVAVATLWRNRLADGFIFAGSTDPSVYGVTVEGSRNTLNGTVHSNTGVYINGSNNTIDGSIEYRNDLHIDGPEFSMTGQKTVGPVAQYPVDFVWQDFDAGPWDHEVNSIYVGTANDSLASGRWRVRGDMTIDGINCRCSDAIFVADGDIFINGSGAVFDRVTLVAGGQIYINGAGGRFSPFVRDLTAYSTMGGAGTKADAIWLNAADCEFSGILYAPGGSLYFDGSDEHTYEVGLVAEIIELHGSSSVHDGPLSANSGYEPSELKLVI
ncbi:MAG: pilus assembly protein TadG-related protein [Armatimonadota bacterium]